MTTRVRLLIQGRVQGVGYRWFARDAALRIGVGGWVRNLPSGDVEAEAEGERGKIAEFVSELRAGPPHARVDRIVEREIPPQGGERGFEIAH